MENQLYTPANIYRHKFKSTRESLKKDVKYVLN